MTHGTPPKRIWKCAGCGLQMPGDCSCVTNVATSWEPDHMMVFKDQLRLETTSENIARDMSEGRFPERSEPQVVVIPEAERKTILTSEAEAMVAAALRGAAVAVSERADWPEDDHGRTLHPGLFARVATVILDLIPQPASAALDKLIAEAVNAERDALAATNAALEAKVAGLVEAAEDAEYDLLQWLECSKSLTAAGFNMDGTADVTAKLTAAISHIKRGKTNG